MLFRRDETTREQRRRRILGIESLEGRTLLSTSGGAAGALEDRATRTLAAQQARAQQVMAYRETHPVPKNPGDSTTTVGDQGVFVASTALTGYKLTHSVALAKVGANYAKTLLGHDTRKVGLDYVTAIFRGNGKEINNLGRTRLVKKVSRDFTSLTKSKDVQYVGNQFTHFGRSVSDKFNKLFSTSK